MSDARRSLPSVGSLLETDEVRSLMAHAPRSVVTDAARAAVAAARLHPASAPRSDADWAAAIDAEIRRRETASLRPVINATGVVLHTNLGRAPLPRAAIDAINAVAAGNCNLEYDLETGERGSRHAHAVPLLCEITGAEDAMVVNNCAGALVLALNEIARAREAIVSRGELVEIGGSFRVPDIMARSGAVLIEVGTTNRTNPGDYRGAISPRTAAIVKVHRSNFTMQGFTTEVPARELATLARDAGIPLLFDLGSGLLLSLEEYGLTGEPTAGQALQDGSNLVVMSGDKMLGGPQAGIILGDAAIIARLRSNPLARALRVDKLTLAALEATLALYRDRDRAVREIPVLRMLTTDAAELRRRAASAATELRKAGVDAEPAETRATVGGGAFPGAELDSAGVRISSDAPAIEQRLREGATPVIARIEKDAIVLDMRGVDPAQDADLVHAVIAAASAL